MHNRIVKSLYDLNNEEHVKKIVAGCLANDRRVQEMFFQMCYGKCMAVAMRYSHDEDSAKDILSDAFIKVFKNIKTYKSEGNIQGWVIRIVVNTALDYLRKNNKEFAMDVNDMSQLHCMSQFDEAFELEGVEEIAKLPANEIIKEIQKLPPGYRAIFNMFVFEGMTHSEIAAKLGIAEGTSKSNLSKARVLLKSRVEKLVEINKEKELRIKEEFRLHDINRV